MAEYEYVSEAHAAGKSGGRYEIRTGAVRKVSDQNRALILEDDTVIPLDTVRSLSGELFDALD